MRFLVAESFSLSCYKMQVSSASCVHIVSAARITEDLWRMLGFFANMPPSSTTPWSNDMDWKAIDQLIEEKSILKHKFYTAWSQGELVLDDLRFYAGQYYALETTFPRLLGHVYAACE